MQEKFSLGAVLHGKMFTADAAHDFRSLVQYYVNVALPLACTREQYEAMDKKAQGVAKRVKYLTPAVFKSYPCERDTKNVSHCNLVLLDLDPDKTTGKSVAQDIVNHPEVASQQLAPFSFVIHHTASSTNLVPRVRVMVHAENIPLEQYANAACTIAKKLGLPPPNSESQVAAQPMFLPSHFKGEEDKQLIVVCELDGRPFKLSDISEQAPAHQPAPRTSDNSNGVDPLFFMAARLENVTLAMATEALNHIDPDIDYREWLDVAAALKHQFGGTDDEDQARELFDLWSSKGTKYAGEDETSAKWDSFQSTPQGRLPKTMRTLMQRAALGGWNSKVIKEDVFQKLVEWIRGAESVTVLTTEAPARILAAPLLNATEVDMLLSQVVHAAKTNFKFAVSINALRKDMTAARAKMDKEAGGKESIPAWCAGVMYMSGHNEFYRHLTGERYEPVAFDNANNRFLKHLTDDPITPSKFALDVIKIPVAYTFDYDPGEDQEVFSKRNGQVYVNTYRRTHPIGDKAKGKEAGDRFTGHLNKLFHDNEHALVLLDYCAFIVQHPGKKIRWAPIIQGAQGCGKTMVFDTVAYAVGRDHTRVIGPTALMKGYTEWAAGRQVVSVEEIRVQGRDKYEVMNTLKPLITNDTVPIERRYNDTGEAANRTNYFFFTNHHGSIVVSPEERRWFIVECVQQTEQQVMAMGPQYFQDYFDFMEHNPGGIRWFLENHTIRSSFNPNGHAPRTVFFKQLVNAGASDAVAAVRRLIAEHDQPLVQADILSSQVMINTLGMEGVKVTAQYLAAILRDEGYKQLDQVRIDGQRHYLWTHYKSWHFDPVAVARERVAKNITATGAELFI